MIDPAALLADTKALVKELIDDLRTHADTDPAGKALVDAEYEQATTIGRTALAKPAWAEGLFAQIAVAWVLGGVIVRFCEDNGLVTEPLIAGPGNRRALALEQRAAYVQANPADDDRHWLRHIFRRFADLPATGDVFGEHNPVWMPLTPSADGARKLLQKLQDLDPATGEVRHDFTDPTWSTRFLGDLYQDLSEHAKKTFALLQTPVFVEEFILDRTLTPAIKTFGLKDTTLIDPTCGSGHFLLGAFDRLLARWQEQEPGTNVRTHVQRALEAIGGIDLNPFAANIARFRLLVAALRAAGYTTLEGAPRFPVNVFVGDSLLHSDTLTGDLDALDPSRHAYAYEDVEQVKALLGRSWSAVVGNPPYIVVKDPALNALYRRRFPTCHRQYSLGVPFTEQFWRLAYSGNPERAGYVGMITTNAFMRAEYGKKLIEKWVPSHDVTHVIDTRGAYIPGHGTPTAILMGRGRRPTSTTVRTVMGIRGEPGRPSNPELGHVWSSIVDLIDAPGKQSDFVSVVDLARATLNRHPWSIGGGGAADLKASLDLHPKRLKNEVSLPIGRSIRAGTDEAFVCSRVRASHSGALAAEFRELAIGEDIRDWSCKPAQLIWYPYFTGSAESLFLRDLWRLRAILNSRATFEGTMSDSGLRWFDYMQHTPSAYGTPLSITFAFVATHNHFVVDRGGRVFKQTAPAIKLPAESSLPDHLTLAGVLNSAVACFWMKQVGFDKGASVDTAGARVSSADTWDNYFNFNPTALKQFPLPKILDATIAERLDRFAQELAAVHPGAIAASAVPTADRLAVARSESERLRAEMIAAQEELDWDVYARYGLTDEPLVLPGGEPQLQLGERAFEIVLARKVAAGEEETSWFTRHRSTPITELPAHWPAEYRSLVERRIELIESDLNIGLIEKPEHKRRWATKPWEERVQTALRGWLLDRLETPRYWPEPAALTSCARLTAEARTDEDFVAVARLYAGRDDADLAAVVAELVRSEAVAYLAAHRYTETGYRKYEQWLATWELQRREDAGEDVGVIPVPPKYQKPDFQAAGWEHRGRLDVPKERFVSYPGAERETDASLVVGWAGWDHLARARALATYYLQSKSAGRDAAFLTPLLAGLAELVPWLKQWFDEPNPDPMFDRPGSQIAALVEAETRALHLTPDDLAAWRPSPRAARGRRKNS